MTWETAADIASVFTASSVVLAVLTYATQAWQYKTRVALAAVKYFLDDIIPLVNEIGILRTSKLPPNGTFPRLEKIEYFSNDWITASQERLAITREQVEFNSSNKEITEKFIPLLNKMEYFALFLYQNNIVRHDAVLITQEVIVQTVEEMAMTIMTVLVTRDNMYPNLRSLYALWYASVDRKTIAERMKAFEDALDIGSTGSVQD